MKQPNKHKILILLDNRWWSGSAYYAIYTGKALQDLGHEVSVAGRVDAPGLEQAQTLGIEVIKGFNPREMSPIGYFREVGKLKQIVADGGFDVLMPHGTPSQLYASRIRKKNDGIKLIRCMSEDNRPKSNIFNRWMHKKYTDGYIASCTPVAQRYKDALNIPDEKMNVVLGPIDISYFDSIETEKMDRGENNLTFGLIARLSPVKGHSIFIQAAAKAADVRPECRFLISGEDVQVKMVDLKAEAFRLGLSLRIDFHPKFSNAPDAINRLDVGVITSTFSEVICRIGMEYMAAGIPVICTDVNCLPEIVIDGETGIVVPYGDVEALNSAMIELAEDGDKRKRMGLAGRKRVEELMDIKPFGLEVEKIIDEIWK